MRILAKLGVIILAIIVLSGLSFVACGSSNETSVSDVVDEPQQTEEQSTQPQLEEELVITIGNLTDMTGPSSNAMSVIDMALDDLVQHFNTNILIPSVKLKVIQYDGQMDPSKFIPGYEWLKEKGADLIYSAVPSVAITIETLVNDDEIVMFAMAPDKAAIEPPGYIFCTGSFTDHEVFSLLKWIAENDWDYQTNGPAKIGGASWNEPRGQSAMKAMEQYTEAHADQFEFAGGYLTNFSFTWGPEVEALKDCDYLYPPAIMASFVKEYRDAGHTAKLFGAGAHFSFINMIDDAGLWNEIDGMLVAAINPYWSEEDEIITLSKQLLNQNHPDEAEKIMRMGWTYTSIDNLYIMLDIIARTTESTGPANFNSQTLLETANSYTWTVDGVTRYNYTETKRYPYNYYRIYEAQAAEEDLFRIDPEPYYHIDQP
ncbi:MAG: ABC transporter substrate-binding protein [Chloroflexi bacterium]|nr:ABC transporter substrate-binding protein [Chloroflexota bacterium]